MGFQSRCLNTRSFYPVCIEDIERRVARRNSPRPSRPDSKATSQLPLPIEGVHGSGTSLSTERGSVQEVVNAFGERIVRVDGDIPIDLPLSNGGRYLFISYDQTSLTHGLHKYPAKFFPELPRWLISRYSRPGDIVLDPFAGSGTTNVEALLLRRHSVGIDVDPFSRFLCRVKVTPLSESELIRCQQELIARILAYEPSAVADTDLPVFPYRDNWFNRDTLLEMAYLRKCIKALDASQEAKSFFLVCLSSIVRAVSNADDNCTRTVIRKRLNKRVYPADALKRFAEAILINVPKMAHFSRLCPADIKVELPSDSDARDIRYPSDFFDLAVTSPPYANAVDYPRTHQLEMYWLDLARGSLTPLKKKHVGTESVSCTDYAHLHRLGIASADHVIKRIFEKDKRRAYIAYKYLEDMRSNLSEVLRTLKNGGRYVVVVGNNRIRGELFENWRYIKDMAVGVGFELECYFGSEIINHFIKVPREERIMTDWVLVLRKP